MVKVQVQRTSGDQPRATDGGVDPECRGSLDRAAGGGPGVPRSFGLGDPLVLPLLTSHLLFL